MDTGSMPSTRQDFVEGMSFAAATVNIVTTDGDAGRAGITVSAMASVSADTAHPSLLVCINSASAGAAPIRDNGVFCVNVLRDDQAHISDTFAGRTGRRGEQRFDCADWSRGATGAPILRGALVAFDCRLTNEIVVGSHHVLFGEVQETRLARQGSPLIYASRAYGTPFRLPEAVRVPDGPVQDNVRLAFLNTIGPYVVPALLHAVTCAMPELTIQLVEGDQRQVARRVQDGEAALGLVYDIALPEGLGVERLAALTPYAVLPAEHRLAASPSVSLAELAQEPLMLLDAAGSGEYFLSLFAHAGVTPTIAMRSASIEMVRSLVAHGHGCSLLVAKPANDMSYDGRRLVSRPLADTVDPVQLALIRRPGSADDCTANAMAEVCRAFFRINKA